MVGISGSGKSTWAKKFMEHNHNYVAINRDGLRLGLVKNLQGYYGRPDLPALEGMVNTLVDATLNTAKVRGYNVLVDNTNLTEKYLNQFINYAGVDSWEWKLFNIAPEVAKIRVLQRDFGHISPDEDINKTLANVGYIDKQAQQFEHIKKYLLDNHLHHGYVNLHKFPNE